MENNEQKLRAILSLPGPKRYSHFIKVAADQRKVWGLFRDGWALVGIAEGGQAFPIWPAQEYASICAVDEWGSYSPREIDLDTLFVSVNRSTTGQRGHKCRSEKGYDEYD